jgi:hypothetical protein
VTTGNRLNVCIRNKGKRRYSCTMNKYAMLWAAVAVVLMWCIVGIQLHYDNSVLSVAITWLHMQCIAQVYDKAITASNVPYVIVYCCMLGSMCYTHAVPALLARLTLCTRQHYISNVTYTKYRYNTRRYYASHVSTHCDSFCASWAIEELFWCVCSTVTAHTSRLHCNLL